MTVGPLGGAMKKKVKVVYLGSPSYLAYCRDCKWNYEKHDDHREGQREIKKHVAETGHTVNLEKTVVTIYEPAEETVSC
jgi:hypothetical protein